MRGFGFPCPATLPHKGIVSNSPQSSGIPPKKTHSGKKELRRNPAVQGVQLNSTIFMVSSQKKKLRSLQPSDSAWWTHPRLWSTWSSPSCLPTPPPKPVRSGQLPSSLWTSCSARGQERILCVQAYTLPNIPLYFRGRLSGVEHWNASCLQVGQNHFKNKNKNCDWCGVSLRSSF